jgi:hypothetical protein
VRRYWWVFAIVAVLSGLYYVIMSGYMAERSIALTLKHGRRQPSVDEQYADLRRLEAAIDGQDRRTAVLRTLTSGASADGIEQARAAVQEQLYELTPLLGGTDADPHVHEGFDRASRFFRDWDPPPMSCLPPKVGLWTTVIFWVTAALAALSGLVRLLAGPED